MLSNELKYSFFGAILASACVLQPISLEGNGYLVVETEVHAADVRRVPAMSLSVYKRVQETQEAIDAKDYTAAKKIITELLQNTKVNEYEKSVVLQVAAILAFAEDNVLATIQLYRNILRHRSSIPAKLEFSLVSSLGMLHASITDWRGALKYTDYSRQLYADRTKEKSQKRPKL